MATQKELAEQLASVTTDLAGISSQLTKGLGEITQKISDLEAALANAGNTTAEVDAAMDALKTSVIAMKPLSQQIDDVVPDVPPPA